MTQRAASLLRWFASLRTSRFYALLRKEIGQIRRNRELVVLLLIPPTVQIVLFGFAQRPDVRNLRLGVADESVSRESRDLVAALEASGTFRVVMQDGASRLSDAMRHGRLDAMVVIPRSFVQDGASRTIQTLIDGTNANTALLARQYVDAILAAHAARGDAARVELDVAFLFNPGLRATWFVVTGTIGILLVLNGSIVAAASLVTEREMGTVEQLLLTPATSAEIVAAKLTPLIVLLSVDVLLAIGVARLVFGIPCRGSFLLLFVAGCFCVVAGVGIGAVIASYCASQRQAQLLSFFVNAPVALVSGATTPIESMPDALQWFSQLNPVRHFGEIARGVMLKGAGVELLWPQLAALTAIGTALLLVSALRFRAGLQ
ncbi:MAG TPA: ABC transporter permease [Thermoanaerobaculia bacterium]|jgi:ABC-2 type transport system permease protein